MIEHWAEARRMHEEAGLDYQAQLSYYQQSGYIYSSPRGLIWAEEWNTYKGGSWLIYLAVGKGSIPEFIKVMPLWLPNVTYCRLLRARHSLVTYSTERLCRYYEIDSSILKSR